MAEDTKPTPAQRRVLENIAAGRPMTYGLSGRSAYGGFEGTLRSLLRRKWITTGANEELTHAGRAALSR